MKKTYLYHFGGTDDSVMGRSNKSDGPKLIGSSDGLAESQTWPYVLAFARRMEAKLAKNRHKGDRDGWITCNPDDLAFRIQDELNELQEALRRVRSKNNVVAPEREAIINEAADVANFAMMVADIYGGCKSANDGAMPRAVNNQKI